MVLLTRQQAEQSWTEPDPNAQFDDLLDALGLYKDISTEYGLNRRSITNGALGIHM